MFSYCRVTKIPCEISADSSTLWMVNWLSIMPKIPSMLRHAGGHYARDGRSGDGGNRGHDQRGAAGPQECGGNYQGAPARAGADRAVPPALLRAREGGKAASSSGSDREPSRFAACRNKPGCLKYRRIRESAGPLRTGTVRGPPSMKRPRELGGLGCAQDRCNRRVMGALTGRGRCAKLSLKLVQDFPCHVRG